MTHNHFQHIRVSQHPINILHTFLGSAHLFLAALLQHLVLFLSEGQQPEEQVDLFPEEFELFDLDIFVTSEF